MRYDDFLRAESLTQEQLLALAWGRLVDDPPDEFVRIPAPPMLMLDRVTEIRHEGPKGRLVAERDVRLDDWFFQCHFTADPVQPGCLGVDAIWQLLGLYCGLRGARGNGRALGCKEVEFAGQIRPGNRVVRYEVAVRRYAALKDSGAAVALGTGRVFVDGEHIYTVTDAKVGVFLGIGYPDYPFPSQNSVGGVMSHE